MALALLMALACQLAPARTSRSSHGVFHANDFADGGGRQHLAVLLCTDYGLVDRFLEIFGLGGHNLLGMPDTALGRPDRDHDLERSRVLHDFLSGGFAAAITLLCWKQPSSKVRVTGRRCAESSFPLLMPTTLFVSINAVIGAFRLVDHIVVMTKGAPDNATTLLLFYIYQIGFGYWDTGYAARSPWSYWSSWR